MRADHIDWSEPGCAGGENNVNEEGKQNEPTYDNVEVVRSVPLQLHKLQRQRNQMKSNLLTYLHVQGIIIHHISSTPSYSNHKLATIAADMTV